ncbi:aspartate/glutamate/uridylate kinase [Nitzschia inconspicua]|uniref:Aspartate/glutamate/uridylate kinase n=1 Tax=Nitzschia inconspicua TaxID=303405 RepID=A0A9K3K982_9STRA|nr:carbamate kinase [Nitzschia inconspicua]KAG7359482.1 aspartate/glutamate/uridylate kinase [Nitzschia inconspicua]
MESSSTKRPPNHHGDDDDNNAISNISLASILRTQPQAPIVIALGGNALLKRGERMTMENQRRNIAEGMEVLAPMLQKQPTTMTSPDQPSPPTIIVHGNGPQVGLLMLESASYEKATGLPQMSLDVLDAETEGMIGYLIEQELQRHLVRADENNSGGTKRGMVTVLSQIVCDPNDPAFDNPTKFVGPVYTKEESQKLGLPVKPDGNKGQYRRVVPSPRPVKLIDPQLHAIRTLVRNDCIVICAGGGGIPVVEDPEHVGRYKGIEAVIDKDRAAAMVGNELDAQGLLILTDVSAVAVNYGTKHEQRIKRVTPNALKVLMEEGHFPPGSMGPKVESVIDFLSGHAHSNDSAIRRWAVIGALKEVDQIMAGLCGTIIMPDSNTENCAVFH